VANLSQHSKSALISNRRRAAFAVVLQGALITVFAFAV
jgi:hypothetical protein